MTQVLTCDRVGCGIVVSADNVPLNWLRVEHIAGMALLGESTADRHFCSKRCLGIYYAVRAAEERP